MINKKIHRVLISIAASWGGRRNSGNFHENEMLVVPTMIQQNLVTLEDDERSPTHWVAITDLGREKLIEFNCQVSGNPTKHV